jgi:hypothetical protein
MMKSRREWVKPELIVLVRSKPEEAVLDGCKVSTELEGPGYWHIGCYGPVGGCGGQCVVLSTS